MKHLITTLLLFVIACAVTVVYFKSLNKQSKRPAEIMQFIPGDAALVAEFSNDEGFYEAFANNQLLSAVLGPDKVSEFAGLKKYLQQAGFKALFDNQHVFLSLHPGNGNPLDVLITTAANTDLDGGILSKFTANGNSHLTVTNVKDGNEPILKVTIPTLKRPFFIAEVNRHFLYGSFSQALVSKAINFDYKPYKNSFTRLPDRQSENALALLYINYHQIKPLMQQVWVNSNPDLFRPLTMLFARATLSLNYKTNALMFNGLTTLETQRPVTYLNLFTRQQPVPNKLKLLLPSTTAYSTTFAVSNPPQFVKDLNNWHNKSGLQAQKKKLFADIKTATGVNIEKDFNQALGKEFAIVTTRFQEKLAIISLADNQQLLPSLVNISTMQSENIGQFNYQKIPFYLLGDVFAVFNKPYFMLINNYLILANTPGELRSYYDSYNNQKFLSKTDAFNNFDGLISERSNIAFFVNFKNINPIFKRDLKPALFSLFSNSDPGFKDYYGLCYQLTATDKNFYTNFCMMLNKTDIAETKN